MSTKSRTGAVPRAALLAVLLLGGGCTAWRGEDAGAHSASAAPAAAKAPEWWRESGDPVLAILVQQGLDASDEIACQLSSLRDYDFQTVRDAKKIGARLGRLLGADQKAPADARARSRDERVQRIGTRRVRLARQIALAYVEVRRLQEGVALRSALRDQYKDNAEVARFRREAGLVSALDGALARSQDEAAQGDLGFAQGRLAEATSQLARLVGDTPEALAARLGTGTIPELAFASQTAPAQDALPAALADNALRETRLEQSLAEARRTVRDARTAYRQGAGDFATLYVAEAAATVVNLALVDARAGRAMATVDVLSGQDVAWAQQGLDPMADNPSLSGETITVTAGCD